MVSLFAWKSLRRRPLQRPRPGRWGRFLCGGAVFALLLLLATVVYAEPRLEVSLDRATISLGDSAVLSMVFKDCSPSGRPELPAVDGLQYGGSSEQSSYVLSDGAMTQSITYSVEVHPTRAGRFEIPPIQENVGNMQLRGRPLVLTVVRGAVPSANGEPATATVQIIVTNTMYLGQIVPIRLDCDCRDNVDNIKLPQLASDNFLLAEISNERQQATRVQRGNLIYNHFEFPSSVTAIKLGKYELGPATWAMNVYGNQRNFFGMLVPHEMTFTSDAPEINVIPVPTAGAPANFNGAVGDFNIAQYEATPTDVSVGDPITLKIRISGRGGFDTVMLPTNVDSAWREFKTYPASSKVDTSDPLRIEGSKYFEEVVTPENAEVKEIPAFAFSFFDPARGAYRTLTHPAIPLTVHPTAATPQPTVLSTGTPQPEEQSEEIVHIKPMIGTVEKPSPPLIQQKGFLALQGLMPFVWICAVLRRKAQERLANNPRLRRQRQVAALVRDGLAELPRPAAANNAEKFYSTVLRLLQEQLGERLDLPAPAITEAALDDLPQRGLRPESVALLRELFRACDQYRYTPEHTSQEMTSLIPKVKAALRDLQAMPAAPARTGFPASVGIVLLLLAATASARADSITDAFTQANRLYEEGKYAQAAAGYGKLIQEGAVAPALYFNLGNAWFKSGQMGRAVLAYRQAEALAPRDPDVRANLQIVRSQIGGNPALPGSLWTRWVGRLTLNEWTVAAAVAVALFFLVLTVRELWPPWKRSGAGLAWALGFASVILSVCLGLAVQQRLVEKFAVVIVSEAVARRGPLAEAQSVFTVHDGAELSVLGNDGDWLQVSDAANHIGWLAGREVALVP